MPQGLGRLEERRHEHGLLFCHSLVPANHHWAKTGGPLTRTLSWRGQRDSGSTAWERRLAAPPRKVWLGDGRSPLGTILDARSPLALRAQIAQG